MICIIAKSFLSLRHRVVCYGKMCLVLQLTPLISTLNHLLRGYPRDPKCRKSTFFWDNKNGVKSMIATVATSKNIASTLKYNENSLKGGEVVFSHGIDPAMPVELQARMLEAMHNQRFKIKAHTIVISHGDRDSRELTPAQEKKLLLEFLNELEKRGTDLNSAPWVIARHGNTDNIHYHMAIMNTTMDGKRFQDKFLGKNVTRAAAAISMKYGLEQAPRAARAEKAAAEKRPQEPKQKPPLTEEAVQITKKVYNRRAAVAAAKKRKEDETRKQQTQAKPDRQTKLPTRHFRNTGGEEPHQRTGFRR